MNAIAAGRPPASSTVTVVVDDSSGPDDPTTDIVTVVVVVLTHFTELCLVVCVIVFDSVVFVSVSGSVAIEETITVAVAKAWLSAPAGMEGARLGASDGLSLGAADGVEDGAMLGVADGIPKGAVDGGSLGASHLKSTISVPASLFFVVLL
jgi:hypothetical protein